MKLVKTVFVVGDKKERIEITVKLTQKACGNIKEIKNDFDSLVDDAYQILAKSYHVFAIKVSK